MRRWIVRCTDGSSVWDEEVQADNVVNRGADGLLFTLDTDATKYNEFIKKEEPVRLLSSRFSNDAYLYFKEIFDDVQD